ncbi:potassium transporter Kup [Rhodanobacter sp. BL-MT-08]
MNSQTHPHPAQKVQSISAALVMSALGVVFGDIATSPLYALQAAFDSHGVPASRDNVLGLLSLVFWALIIVVSCKYVAFIMRANNNGEGGIMSLMALTREVCRDRIPRPLLVGSLALGLIGAALFFGDSVITPAVSVLSAVEGLQLAAPALKAWVLPISVVILLGLFFVQRVGSAHVGKIFGPVMALWLLVVASLGVYRLIDRPDVLIAVDPMYAAHYFAKNGFRGFETLGAVILVLTGAEALYADMGHFGAGSIRVAWFALALPCLLLSYFGQGAFLLGDPAAAVMPFYRMVPHALLYPMIVLAALATVIASQAVIAGAFSMARQAMLLGYLPRMRVQHTSHHVEGQVYLPGINMMLLVLVMAAVLIFRSSDALASAYGIAVSGTMLATTMLALLYARFAWHWRYVALIPLGIVLTTIDVAFFGANILKISSGGWFPLLLGAVMYVLMSTWHRGRRILINHLSRDGLELKSFVRSIAAHPPHRVDGSAVFLTARSAGVPVALLHNLKHNRVLHRTNIVLTLEFVNTPFVSSNNRLHHVELGDGFHQVNLRFGFAEDTDVPQALSALDIDGEQLDPAMLTYFASRENIVPSRLHGMSLWRAHLFALMARNALAATTHFNLPDNRMVEIGTRVDV